MGICHSATLLYIHLWWLFQTDRQKLQDIVFCWPLGLLSWQTVYIVSRLFEEFRQLYWVVFYLASMMVTGLAECASDVMCIRSSNTCFQIVQLLKRQHHKVPSAEMVEAHVQTRPNKSRCEISEVLSKWEKLWELMPVRFSLRFRKLGRHVVLKFLILGEISHISNLDQDWDQDCFRSC